MSVIQCDQFHILYFWLLTCRGNNLLCVVLTKKLITYGIEFLVYSMLPVFLMNYFRLSIVAVLLVCTPLSATLSETLTWAGCGITKKAFMAELAKGFEEETGVKIKLEGGGATRGVRDAANALIDMGGSCRMTLPLTDPSELHVTMHPVAWDALAVLVHPSNPVDRISTEQLKKIYTGKLTNWKYLGGPDRPIEVYVRRGKISGVGYALRQYLFKDSNMSFYSTKLFRSSGPLEKAIEKSPYAIGVSGVSSARKRKVQIIGLDDVTPTPENIQAGRYELYRPLYIVTQQQPKGRVKEFIKFATSKKGRQILRDNQTVPYLDAIGLMSKSVIYGLGVK